MKKVILTLSLFLLMLPAMAQVERPRLVVGLVVDQMRWDYLYYYYNDYSEGGLKRLLSEGYSYENTQINYSPAVWRWDTPAYTPVPCRLSTALQATGSGRTASRNTAAPTPRCRA